jgi:hypothetical protein
LPDPPPSLPDRGPDRADALELELRQLHGVRLVAIGELGGTTVVEIATDPTVDVEEVREQARRVVTGHITGPVSVEVVDDDPTSMPPSRSDRRVRLLLTVPTPGGPTVEVHLAHHEQRVMVEAPTADRLPIAAAVLEGLRRLGLPAPWEAVSAHDIVDELGSGTLVVLRNPATGVRRRGLATGRDSADATARAVLNALNRYLQASSSDVSSAH